MGAFQVHGYVAPFHRLLVFPSRHCRRVVPLGAEAFEKTLGVIGCGRIGRQVAHYAQSFGMKPIGCDAFVTADEMKDAGLEKVDLETLLKRADVITIHTPGGKDTKNMIGKDQLALCKDGVYIVNAARGGLINEAALLEGLQSGKVRLGSVWFVPVVTVCWCILLLSHFTGRRCGTRRV